MQNDMEEFQSAKKSPLANTNNHGYNHFPENKESDRFVFQSAKKSPLANTKFDSNLKIVVPPKGFQSAKKSPLANT